MRTRGLKQCAGAVMALCLAGGSAAWANPDQITPEAIAQAQQDCREQPFSLLVKIRNIKESKGIITLDLHGDNPQTFLKRGANIGRMRVRAVKGEAEACVPVDKAGAYAIAAYQDKNINWEFDKNFLGLPAEPYGVSNDPSMSFGPPKLAESLVRVQGPLTPATITLHN